MTSKQQQALLCVVQWYADSANWRKHWVEVDADPGQAWEATSPALEDAGKLARDLLKEMG